jgi:hypothetical protein
MIVHEKILSIKMKFEETENTTGWWNSCNIIEQCHWKGLRMKKFTIATLTSLLNCK